MKTNVLKVIKATALCSVVFLFAFSLPNRSPRTISGVITDAEKTPLIGAVINVEGSKKGTVTDLSGEFELVVSEETKYLSISFAGFESKEVKLNAESFYQIILEEGLTLDEVVVVGYGKSRRRSERKTKKSSDSAMEYAPSVAKPSSPSAVMSTVSGTSRSESRKPAISESIYDEEMSSLSDKKDSEKAKNERAGQLTAGEWNDLNNWEDWEKLVQETDYKEMGKHWGINPGGRVSIFVSNQYELPIPDCNVSLRSGKEVIWSAKTDNAGKAELWLMNDDKDLELVVQSKANKYSTKKVLRIDRGVNRVRFEEECSAPLKAEIMFVVDATGSMGDEIEFLKSELNDVIGQVETDRSSIDFRWGSVFYRDATDTYLTRQSPLSEDKDRIINFINMQSAGGGGDYPEAVNEGLEEALMQDWSEDAIARIVFLVLDAPPHHNQEVTKEMQSQIEYAAARGIKIIPITASGINRQTEYLMKFMSIMTNGTYVFLTDHSGIGNAHLDPVVTDFEVEKLNDLLVRLVRNYTDPGTCIVQEDQDPLFTKIEVFPNPAINFVQVKVPEGIERISLTTSTGQVIHKEEVKGKCDINLDLTSYVDGMYVVNFYAADQVFSYKLVKTAKA